MKVYVLAEGQTGIAILQRLLQRRVDTNVEFVSGGGKSSAISLAQSLLVARLQPVAVVMDADSVDIERVREQETIYYDLLKARAMGVPFRVLLAVPAIEFLFFESPGVLKDLGIKVTERDSIDAKYRPKQALDRLLRQTGTPPHQFIERLPDSAIERLSELPLVKELTEFVQKPTGSRVWSTASEWLEYEPSP